MYWAGKWGLTDQELRDAVAAAGQKAADVASHLGKPLGGDNLGLIAGSGALPQRA